MLLKQRCPDIALLALFLDENGGREYHCSLAVREESPLRSLAEVKNRHFALTQRYSTCGWLSVVDALNKAGNSLEANSYRFLGTHTDTVMALTLDEADVAAARSDIVDRYLHMGIRHLSINGPYPNFVMVANSRVMRPEHRRAIEAALLELKPEGAARRAEWHPFVRYGAIAATDDLFEPTRRQMRAIGELE